ncbi:hypothetical protein J3U68_06430 [Snodgrassella sp. B3882]|nr:hypothetical protein [Snodgrassella sp. B3882]
MHKAIGNGQDPQNQSLIGGGLRFENLFWEQKGSNWLKIVQKQNQIFGRIFFNS